MTARTEIEHVLDAFLAEGPTTVSDRAVLQALTAIDRTPQRRGLVAPWRFPSMTPLARLATVALVAAVAIGGAFYLLGGSKQGVGSGGPTRTPTISSPPTAGPSLIPSATPIASSSSNPTLDTQTWTPFTSTINGFSARVPSDATVMSATKAGDLRSIRDAAIFDVAVSPALRAEISGVSMKVPAGVTPDQWLAAYRQPIIDASGDACSPTRDKWEAVMVDGQMGGLHYGCEWYRLSFRSPSLTPDNGTRNYFEAVFFVQERVYIFQVNLGGLSRFTTWQQFVQSSPADEETRQLLRAFLTTVTLNTGNAKNP
jgi:hypothetical protein